MSRDWWAAGVGRLLVTGWVLCAPIAVPAQAPADDVVRFSFVPADMTRVERGSPQRLDLVVGRSSSDVERDGMYDFVTETGPESLLDALRDAPRDGGLTWPGHGTRKGADVDELVQVVPVCELADCQGRTVDGARWEHRGDS